MKNLEYISTRDLEIKSLSKELDSQKIIPFGAQYLEKPKVDSPGEVHRWNWQPSVLVHLGSETVSWPATTGTGPTAKEDERYGENG